MILAWNNFYYSVWQMVIFYFHHFFNIYSLEVYYNSTVFFSLYSTNYLYNCISYLFSFLSCGLRDIGSIPWVITYCYHYWICCLNCPQIWPFGSPPYWFFMFFQHLCISFWPFTRWLYKMFQTPLVVSLFQPWNQPYL